MEAVSTTFRRPASSLSKRLTEARHEIGLTQTEMAKELGVSLAVLSRWENGHDEPRRGMVMAYALRCSVPLDWLEHGDAGEPGASLRSR